MRPLYSVRFVLASTLFIVLTAARAGPWHAASPNTYGWRLMTPQEREEHQRRMRGFTAYEECKAYQAKHHALMAERAQQAGLRLAPRPDSGCEQLRARGRLQ
ncbi:hypothetical protein C0Z18_01975 [Trinickia dabaoshanensis]|uniref:DUF4148 domain-containing protein n=1 Tax=Trinickia dabaoshanensis TaxID=564714 RepID=A0A2N7W3H5_9BURK|nr:hypothetical protein C0Z18_01975 [Trinickia dabaoshanensis]